MKLPSARCSNVLNSNITCVGAFYALASAYCLNFFDICDFLPSKTAIPDTAAAVAVAVQSLVVLGKTEAIRHCVQAQFSAFGG